MSTPDLVPVRRRPHRKPRPDVYTLLLGLALAAMAVACLFLWLETRDYGSPPYEGAPQVRIDAGPWWPAEWSGSAKLAAGMQVISQPGLRAEKVRLATDWV